MEDIARLDQYIISIHNGEPVICLVDANVFIRQPDIKLAKKY